MTIDETATTTGYMFDFVNVGFPAKDSANKDCYIVSNWESTEAPENGRWHVYDVVGQWKGIYYDENERPITGVLPACTKRSESVTNVKVDGLDQPEGFTVESEAYPANYNHYVEMTEYKYNYTEPVTPVTPVTPVMPVTPTSPTSEQQPSASTPAIANGMTATSADGTATIKVESAAKKTVAYAAPSTAKLKAAKSLSVPDTVKLADGNTYKVATVAANAFKGTKAKKITLGKNVTKVAKNAFKGSKATTVVVKTKGLKKTSVKGCFAGSKVKTVQVKVGNKKANKKQVKKYKKFVTKKITGTKAKKLTVK